MTDYEITYLVDPETLTEDVVDDLYDTYDCLAGGRPHGRAFVTLTVAASNAEAAIKDGLGTLQQHGLRVVDVDRDLVDVAEIARRTNTSRQTVHNWINGARREGFPPVFTDAGKGLWLWGEVQQWAIDQAVHIEDPDMRYPSRSDHDQASFHVRHGWGRPFGAEHLWERRGPRPALVESQVERLVIAYTTEARTRPDIVVDTHHAYSEIIASTNRQRARRRPTHA